MEEIGDYRSEDNYQNVDISIKFTIISATPILMNYQNEWGEYAKRNQRNSD